MYTGKKILVTGGAGFLGSNLVKRLVTDADTIWVLDDLFTGSLRAIPKSSNVHFVHGSVTDATLLSELISQVQYVFHFAVRNITLSTQQPESDFRVNTEGTVQILLQALKFKHQLDRVVYASTASVYGNSPVLPTDESLYQVTVPYAASKMAGELFASAYASTYQLPVTCVRYSNVYGPGQVSSNPYCGVVSKFMEAYKKGEPLKVYGDGTQTRDFTFVDDAMEATLLVGKAKNTIGEVYNIGTGIETSVNELAKHFLTMVGDPNYPIQFANRRIIDTVSRRCIDASKIRQATRWKPRYSLTEGLKETWTWYQNYPE